MSKPLPTGGFRWVEGLEQLYERIATLPEAPREVDLEYPQELHEAHYSYTLGPERMVVQKKRMSDYQHNLIGDDGGCVSVRG